MLEHCDICGAAIQNPIIDSTEEPIHIMCYDCATARSTCKLCHYNTDCAFHNDPSTLPKTIVKTISQNGMIIQTQIINPERVDKTCKEKCFCFDNEIGCLRQFNTCGKVDFKWKKVQYE